MGRGMEGRGRSGWSEWNDTERAMRAGRDGWARKEWRETPVTCEPRRWAGGPLVAVDRQRKKADQFNSERRGRATEIPSCM